MSNFYNKCRSMQVALENGEDPETILNNHKIDKGETTYSVNPDGTEKAPGTVLNDEQVNAEKKVEGIEKVLEIEEILENEKSLESDNSIVKSYLNTIRRQYGISVEAVAGQPFKKAVDKAVALEADRNAWAALVNVIRDSYAKFSGFNYFSVVYDHEIFNRYKPDITKLTDVAFDLVNSDSSKQNAINSALSDKSAKFYKEASNLVFDNSGNLRDPAKLGNQLIDTAKQMIKVLAKAEDITTTDPKAFFKELDVPKRIGSDSIIFVSNDKEQFVLENTKVSPKVIDYKDAHDWFRSVFSSLNGYAKDVRNLEKELHGVIKSIKGGSHNYLTWSLSTAVTKTLAQILGLYVVHVVTVAKFIVPKLLSGFDKNELAKIAADKHGMNLGEGLAWTFFGPLNFIPFGNVGYMVYNIYSDRKRYREEIDRLQNK